MKRATFAETRGFYAAVGGLIAKARHGRMTQEMLGKKTSLTRTSIINIEKGRQQIFLHTLVDIARTLGLTPADLIPPTDSLETLLREKSKKGIEWIKTSVAESERKESR